MKIERTSSKVLKYRVKVGATVILTKSRERAAELAAIEMAKGDK